MPAAVPTEAERSRDRVASADAIFPDPFVTRIEDDAGIRFLQPARPEAPQFLVQLRVQFADRTRAKLMAEQFLGDRLRPVNSSVGNRPGRSCGIRSGSLPTRVTSVRG